MVFLNNISRRSLIASGLALGITAPFRSAFATQLFKVAGIHASPVENAWNSVLHKALQGAHNQGLIQYVYSESVSGADYPRAMRQYAEAGCGLIVGECFPIEKQARDVAADYPDVSFLFASSGEAVGPNFGVFASRSYESIYLTGMLAGRLTKTNIVGSVAAIPIPEINVALNAFAAGIRAVNPDVVHKVTFIGTFFDPPKAREAGLALVDAGADVLFGERIGTADAAEERGAKSIGTMVDYTSRYPNTVFANSLLNFTPLITAALDDVNAGRQTGMDYTPFTLMNVGGNDISYVKGIASSAAEAEMEERRAQIKASTFKVGVDPAKPA